MINPPEPPPFATNEHASEAVAEAGLPVRGLQLGRCERGHNGDISNNVDLD
jgi:hypothetical protein